MHSVRSRVKRNQRSRIDDVKYLSKLRNQFSSSSERSWYENMTEQDVCDKLKSAALDSEQFELIRNEISQVVGQ